MKKLIIIRIVLALLVLLTATAVFAADSSAYTNKYECRGVQVKGYAAEKGLVEVHAWPGHGGVENVTVEIKRANKDFTVNAGWDTLPGVNFTFIEVFFTPNGSDTREVLVPWTQTELYCN